MRHLCVRLSVLPPNTTAEMRVPTTDPARVREGAVPASEATGGRALEPEDGAVRFEVGSGTYVFRAAYGE